MEAVNGVATRVRVVESSQVAEARRVGASMAARLGFDESETAKVAIAITEAATNLLKHAGGGEILMRPLEFPESGGLEMLVLDKGPGMSNFNECLRDGYSTTGTLGTGLGAMARMSGSLSAYSQLGKGTALAARFWPDRVPSNPYQVQISGLSVAVNGERVCGDAWVVRKTPAGFMIMVVDGLGHGAPANEAALSTVDKFHNCAGRSPSDVLDAVHRGIRHTRGACAMVVAIDLEARSLGVAGIGNIAGIVMSGDQCRHLVSMNGTLGHHIHAIREFSHPWNEDSLLVLYSDGLTSRWDLNTYPGLSQRSPSLIAGVLYRDLARERDDATVVVVRHGSGE
jgi:anti-sigma regulatory factor (Ser/Thr protein kinase)